MRVYFSIAMDVVIVASLPFHEVYMPLDTIMMCAKSLNHRLRDHGTRCKAC